MKENRTLLWFNASQMPQIGIRKTFLNLVYVHYLLKTFPNLVLMEHYFVLSIQVKSSKLNPVYLRWWCLLLVAPTIGSFLSFCTLNCFLVLIWSYIWRRIFVIDISFGERVPVEYFFSPKWHVTMIASSLDKQVNWLS